MMPDNVGERSEERGAEPLSRRQVPEIDVERLADMVYRLMLDDIRLARAFGVPLQHRSP